MTGGFELAATSTRSRSASWARFSASEVSTMPELLAVGPDQAHLGYPDPLVDPCRVALWRAPIEPTRDRHYRKEWWSFKRARR